MFKQHPVTYGFAALCLIALPAQAAVYVTGRGSDTNPCTIALPCRQISYALTRAGAGGEIIVAGSGEFEPFTVNKSISILAAPGVQATVLSSTETVITISPAATTSYVHLSGLDVTSNGTAHTGIEIGLGSVRIDHCNIHDTTGTGIEISLSGGNVNVSDTTVTVTPGGEWVNVHTGTVNIEHCTFLYTPFSSPSTIAGGIVVNAGNFVLRDSVLDGWSASSSASVGLETDGGIGSPIQAVVDHCLFTNFGYVAIQSSGYSTITVSNSTLAYNKVGVQVLSPPATLFSLGNNVFVGNSTPTIGTFPIVGFM